MAYDFVEIDEYVNGERRESLITAVPQFIQKIGSGAGILTQGLLLSAYGYVRTTADYDNIFSPERVTKIPQKSKGLPEQQIVSLSGGLSERKGSWSKKVHGSLIFIGC